MLQRIYGHINKNMSINFMKEIKAPIDERLLAQLIYKNNRECDQQYPLFVLNAIVDLKLSRAYYMSKGAFYTCRAYYHRRCQ